MSWSIFILLQRVLTSNTFYITAISTHIKIKNCGRLIDEVDQPIHCQYTGQEPHPAYVHGDNWSTIPWLWSLLSGALGFGAPIHDATT